MYTFELANTALVQQLTTIRQGETKLGQTIQLTTTPSWEDALRESDAKFVLLGIAEDIGVRANYGIGGTQTIWPAFLKSFVNIQDTQSLPGNTILALGQLRFEADTTANVDQLREQTAQIDNVVYPIIEKIVAAHKIPIVIGGGHNNAYPILKGCSLAKGNPINAINLDPHSDFRQMEGRHSGNGFRYAYEEGYLKKYSILGLHEAYNSTAITTELEQNDDLLPVFWEAIFLRAQLSWQEAIQFGLDFVQKQPFGVELDTDAIENTLSSAMTPVGISAQQAMLYLYQCGLSPMATYLHLPEAIALRNDGLKSNLNGKLLSYLVQGFIKGVKTGNALS